MGTWGKHARAVSRLGLSRLIGVNSVFSYCSANVQSLCRDIADLCCSNMSTTTVPADLASGEASCELGGAVGTY